MLPILEENKTGDEVQRNIETRSCNHGCSATYLLTYSLHDA